MSAKLNHNNFFLKATALIILLSTASCFKLTKKQYYHTEILCPNRADILVRYTRADEIRLAIIKANEKKKFFKTSERYTVMSFPGNRSFKIEKMSPEEMLKCYLRELPIANPDKNYTKYVP